MSEYIITCDEETASRIGNDVESMKRNDRADGDGRMSGDYIKTFKLEVEIQENGIIRDPFGWIIGRCNDDWLRLVTRHEMEPPKFCPEYGARVIGTEAGE